MKLFGPQKNNNIQTPYSRYPEILSAQAINNKRKRQASGELLLLFCYSKLSTGTNGKKKKGFIIFQHHIVYARSIISTAQITIH
jgi:hypothetical protein